MNCKNCGATIELNNPICGYCGTSVSDKVIVVAEATNCNDLPSSVGTTITDSYKGQKRKIKTKEYLGAFWRTYKEITKVTAAMWVILYFYTCSFPDRTSNMSAHNNILLSPMGETNWIIRGCLLIIVIPLLLTWLYLKDDSKFNVRTK
ncbi:hypothetical protein [Mucilaginibacter myungsuensis]|uniref:Uncharacterized protein n=1 Tax=Mucilaginibacter myungsuensis TaxID=649104 RepID=A0A929KX43_9SPHI|nr:hypothetical protein [Mucilaginibacter myungsuensis]MBE9661553.1 hypothetical protein [Mucilaginibacter myungsuensis]MDN3597696.1 hypothetical protein [Mucilaginibacter myungsuensis]